MQSQSLPSTGIKLTLYQRPRCTDQDRLFAALHKARVPQPETNNKHLTANPSPSEIYMNLLSTFLDSDAIEFQTLSTTHSKDGGLGEAAPCQLLKPMMVLQTSEMANNETLDKTKNTNRSLANQTRRYTSLASIDGFNPKTSLESIEDNKYQNLILYSDQIFRELPQILEFDKNNQCYLNKQLRRQMKIIEDKIIEFFMEQQAIDEYLNRIMDASGYLVLLLTTNPIRYFGLMKQYTCHNAHSSFDQEIGGIGHATNQGQVDEQFRRFQNLIKLLESQLEKGLKTSFYAKRSGEEENKDQEVELEKFMNDDQINDVTPKGSQQTDDRHVIHSFDLLVFTFLKYISTTLRHSPHCQAIKESECLQQFMNNIQSYALKIKNSKTNVARKLFGLNMTIPKDLQSYKLNSMTSVDPFFYQLQYLNCLPFNMGQGLVSLKNSIFSLIWPQYMQNARKALRHVKDKNAHLNEQQKEYKLQKQKMMDRYITLGFGSLVLYLNAVYGE